MAMKDTGIARKVDDLGRIVLPMELRKTMEINIRDPLEIFVDGDSIVLKKYEPCCIFCGKSEKMIDYKGKLVCEKCRKALANRVD